MSRHPVLTVFLMTFLAAGVLSAGRHARAGERITLERALRLAIEQSPILASADHASGSADQDVLIARAAYFPKVDLYARYSATNQPVASFGFKLNQGVIGQQDFDPAVLNDPGSLDNFQYGLRFRQAVYAGGKRRWALRGARLDKQAAATSADQVRDEVLFSVVEAYLGALEAREQAGLLDEAVALARRTRDKIAHLHEQGMVNRADLLSADVRLSGLRQDLLTAHASVSVADRALLTAIGAETLEPFEPVASFGEPLEESYDRKEWFDLSALNRPDLKAMALRVEKSRASVQMARSLNRPGIEAMGGYEWNADDGLGEPKGNYMMAVVAEYTVYDGGERSAKLNKAATESAGLGARLEALRLAARLEVDQSLKELESSRGRIEIADQAIEQAQEAFRIISDRYEAGLADVIELLTSQVALTESKVRRTNALYRYHHAKAMLQKASGLAGQWIEGGVK